MGIACCMSWQYFKALLLKLIALSIICLVFMYYITNYSTQFTNNYNIANQTTIGLAKRSDIVQENYQDLIDTWCWRRRTRFDWIRLLKSCGMFLEWTPHRLYWKKLYITSSKLSYISRAEINGAGMYSRFYIQAVSANGAVKNYGGDSWRVHVRGASSVPVTVTDQRNGTYEVVFLIVEAGVYMAEIVLDYTLCDGLKDPPDDWFTRGNSQGKYQPPDALPGNEHPYLLQTLSPPFAFTVYPTEENPLKDTLRSGIVDEVCPLHPCLLWDGYGRWLNGKWIPYRTGDLKENPTPHKKGKGVFWIYGDSVGDFLYKSIIRNKYFCNKLFVKCMRTYNWVYKLQNENITRAKLEWDSNDFDINRILSELEEVLFDPSMDENSVILLNLGLHYVQDIQFSTYQALLMSVIRLLQSHAESPSGFHGRVIWKTSTAMFRERYGDPASNARHAKTLRFLTVPRLELYNAYATSVMCDARIDVIDIYPMSDSYPQGTGAGKKKFDALHYSPNVFKAMEDFLQGYFS